MYDIKELIANCENEIKSNGGTVFSETTPEGFFKYRCTCQNNGWESSLASAEKLNDYEIFQMLNKFLINIKAGEILIA